MRDDMPAIPANHIAVLDEALYHLVVRPALRRHFDHVWYSQLGPLPDPAHGPYLFYLNHSAWWDAHMLMLILRGVLKQRFKAYAMMEERQLRAYRFYSWAGAFSVDRKRAGEAERVQRYAVNRLRESPRNALFIFPQGKIVPNERRPLQLYPGAARIAAELPGALTLCPIALRYDYLGQQYAHAFVRIGPCHRVEHRDANDLLADMQDQLTAAVDGLREDVIGGHMANFSELLAGHWGIDKVWDVARILLGHHDRDGGPAAAAAKRWRTQD
jgi:chlorobactene lauroyltransferase